MQHTLFRLVLFIGAWAVLLAAQAHAVLHLEGIHDMPADFDHRAGQVQPSADAEDLVEAETAREYLAGRQVFGGARIGAGVAVVWPRDRHSAPLAERRSADSLVSGSDAEGGGVGRLVFAGQRPHVGQVLDQAVDLAVDLCHRKRERGVVGECGLNIRDSAAERSSPAIFVRSRADSDRRRSRRSA